MEVFREYLDSLKNVEHRKCLEEVLIWILNQYPQLVPKIAWNQPMFTDHGTFIIAFSVSKQHMAVAPERAVINTFSKDIIEAGYEHTKELIRMPWNRLVDYVLLERIIQYNITDKVDCSTFWRK